MTEPAATLSVRLRVDIGPDCSIGPGKIALLEQIERSGSLSQAGRILKMSYRRAWLLLDDLNRTLGRPVTTASVGGAGGGGARITPFGRQIVAAFREIERTAAAAAAQQLEWLQQTGVGAAAPTAPRRAVNRSLGRSRAAGAEASVADTTAAAPADGARLKSAAGMARRQKRGRAVKLP